MSGFGATDGGGGPSYNAVDMIARARQNHFEEATRRNSGECAGCPRTCAGGGMIDCALVSWENAAATYRHMCRNLDAAGIFRYDDIVRQGIAASTTPQALSDEIRRQCNRESMGLGSE